METIVTIPEPILSAADQLAAELQISRSELYAQALDAFIKSHQRSEITHTLDQIYATESSTLDPIIWQMQCDSLIEDEWWNAGMSF